jgi:hypothetical protein
VFVILAYAPLLLCLPVLLVVGLVFVVVPGGFIVVLVGLYYVVLAGLYYASSGLTGLVGLAASTRWQARALRARRASTSSEDASPSRQPSFVPRGAPIRVTVGFEKDPAVGPSPNGALNRRRTGDLDRIKALDARRADRQDHARPV